MKKKSLKMRLYALGSVISGLLSLQVFVVIVLFVLSDLGASKSADIYPLDIYPTTAWWVYVVLAVVAIMLFCFSVYLDNLNHKEEDKVLSLRFKKFF